MRSFWISLLFVGLLAAGLDGFRERERGRVRVGAPSVPTATEDGDLHHADYGTGIPPR